MRLGTAAVFLTIVLASCGQTIQARCNGDAECIKKEEHKIASGPGSPFWKSERGGPG